VNQNRCTCATPLPLVRIFNGNWAVPVTSAGTALLIECGRCNRDLEIPYIPAVTFELRPAHAPGKLFERDGNPEYPERWDGLG